MPWLSQKRQIKKRKFHLFFRLGFIWPWVISLQITLNQIDHRFNNFQTLGLPFIVINVSNNSGSFVKNSTNFPSGISMEEFCWKILTTLSKNSLQTKAHHDTFIKLLYVDFYLYRIVKKYLQKTNTKYYTHLTSTKRILEVVTKGLHRDTSRSCRGTLQEKKLRNRSVIQF